MKEIEKKIDQGPRSFGDITVYNEKGYAYIPKAIRKEVGLQGAGKIPFFVTANTILLIRTGVKKEDVLKGLKLLAKDLDLRWMGAEEK